MLGVLPPKFERLPVAPLHVRDPERRDRARSERRLHPGVPRRRARVGNPVPRRGDASRWCRPGPPRIPTTSPSPADDFLAATRARIDGWNEHGQRALRRVPRCGRGLMLSLPEEADVLARLVAWGRADPAIRALVLTSSRARADESVDDLSDYDLIVAVDDPAAFLADDTWVDGYGRPLARWGDEHELYGSTTTFCGVVYADGVKVDYTVWPAAFLERVAQAETLPEDLDVGYRVLLDKDGADCRLAGGDLPSPHPREADGDGVPSARRGVLVGHDLRRQGSLARGGRLREVRARLRRQARRASTNARVADRARPRLVAAAGRVRPRPRATSPRRPPVGALRARTSGTDIEDNWNALFRTTALFRRVATEVGDALGYAYPLDVDEAVTAHLEAVRLGSSSAPSTARGTREAGR